MMENEKSVKITLSAARVNAGLKQKDAAKKLGINVSTLANYEAGKTKPDVPTAYKLAKLYNMSIDNIFF